MSFDVEQIVRQAVREMLDNIASERKIQEQFKKHQEKIHFVPVQYRVFGGLLQSLNIRFGNFIERLMANIVEHDAGVTSLSVSGKKLRLSMTSDTDTLIDSYITNRQLPNSADDCTEEFSHLLDEIIRIETTSNQKQSLTKDIDALFQANDGQIIFLEIKYNDDHDTGKFVDINRKFLKTYAGLVNLLNIESRSQLKPIIYYFNPTKRWGPIYVPTDHILRGTQLFDTYFSTSYDEIDAYMRQIGEDPEIIQIFDGLYASIRNTS